MKHKVSVEDNKIVSYSNEHDKTSVEKAIKENLDFFGRVKTSFEVIFLETREEMDKISGYKTEEWVVGRAKGKDKIFIFSEEKFDKVSSHQKKRIFSCINS